MSFSEVSHRIDEERRAKFCGTASLRVKALRFSQSDGVSSDAPGRRSVEPLKRMFREEKGCRKEDSRHHAKAIISPHALATILLDAGIQAERLRNETEPYIELEIPPGTQLECLQRYDKVSAADEAFDGVNKRWVVDLFLDDLSEELRRLFVEEYDYQKAPDDGKLYRKIREYQGIHGQKNQYFERLWLGQLSAISRNRRDLFEQLKRHDAYLRAFDDLLDIPALFCGFRLTVIHQMISMRCEELNLAYLKLILDKWRKICGNDKQKMRRIGKETIEALQGTAPGACSADHTSLLGKLKAGHILGNFSEQEREEIWSQICVVSRECLIPSLHTFFEDLKFLKGAADSMRRLMHLSPRDTIKGRLESMFIDARQDQGQCVIQTSDHGHTTVPGHTGVRFELGYRQLWLAAFRVYREIPPEPQKKDLLAKPRKTADEVTLFWFASLASQLGFESEQIRNILLNSPDRQVAERSLLTVRRPGQYKYKDLEGSIQNVMRIFNTAEPVSVVQSPVYVETDERRKEPARFGVPHDIDHDRDKAMLFLPTLHKKPENPFPNMTSFFVRQSVYLAFFGLELPSEVDLCALRDAAGPIDVFMPEPASVRGQTTLLEVEEGPGVSGRMEDEAQKQQEKLSSILNALSEQNANLQHLTQTTEEKQLAMNALINKGAEEQARLDRLVSASQAQLDQLSTLQREKDRELENLESSLQARQGQINRLTEEERRKQEILEDLDQQIQAKQERLNQSLEESRQDDVEEQARSHPVLQIITEEQRHQATDEDRSIQNMAAGLKEPLGTTGGYQASPETRTRRLARFEFEKLMGSPEDVPSVNELSKVSIIFKTRERNGEWTVSDELLVDPSDASIVERVAAKYMRKQFCLYDTEYHNLIPKTCFKKVTANGTNTILVIPVSRASRGEVGAVPKRANIAGNSAKEMNEIDHRDKKRRE